MYEMRLCYKHLDPLTSTYMPLLSLASEHCPDKMMEELKAQFKQHIGHSSRSDTDACLLFVDPSIKDRISLYYRESQRSAACLLFMKRKDKHLAGELTNLIVNRARPKEKKPPSGIYSKGGPITLRKMTDEERAKYRC